MNKPSGFWLSTRRRWRGFLEGTLLANAVALCPLAWLGLMCLVGCDGSAGSKQLDLRGQAMGTTWQVILPGSLEGFDSEELKQGIIARIERVESQMSHWREDSLVSQFNRRDSTLPLSITPELATVIREAQRTSELSQGAFDITVAPLVDLWGFGPTGRPDSQPTDETIASVRNQVGSEHLRLVEASDGSITLSKQIPQLQIDLSALAKGYAIDVVAAYLDEQRLEHYLIEIGGELRAQGTNPQGNLWRIGLEQPDADARVQVRGAVALHNQAIATSGSYRNAIRDHTSEAGAYSHIIDPRTGRPVRHRLISVSVITSSAMRADAWATALMVLGPEAGFQLASDEQLAATFVFHSPKGPRERSTAAFRASLVSNHGSE